MPTPPSINVQALSPSTIKLARPVTLLLLLFVYNGLFALNSGRLFATEPPSSSIDFNRDIRPIFAEHCLACHGPETSEAGLDLATRDSATRLLESGSLAINTTSPDESELLRRVLSMDAEIRMPPGEHPALDPRSIDLLRQWIAQGALYDTHWSFKPISRPSQQIAAFAESGTHPIDGFVTGELTKFHATLSPEAPPEALIKRVHLDLLGLLPSPEQASAFTLAYQSASDTKKELLYRELIDECLSSPHFGERWGRHWLDIARYADSDGYEKDRARPDAYVYRDWVIQALNANMPFDQFTIEQIAGDLLPNATPSQRIATAFHRQTLTNTEGGVDQEEFRVAANFDRTDTIGTVWLGLTIGCAKCHTHKYDPITHREYFQFFAFMNEGEEQSEPLPIGLPESSSILTELLRVESQLKNRYRELYEAEQEWERAQREKVEAKENASLSAEDLGLTKAVVNALKMYPEKRTNETRDLLFQFFVEQDPEAKRLQAEQKEILQQTGVPVQSVRVFSKAFTKRTTHRFERGDFLSPAEPVTTGIPRALSGPTHDSSQMKDRLDLARWIVSTDNPLTARVIANQIWSKLFGQGIVRTAGDFGVRGDRPSHPELLDWLAIHFRDDLHWNLKSFIKTIMLSHTYRQTSAHREAMNSIDPTNQYLSRQNRLRLEGEIVRDVSLQAGGLLCTKIGGPSVFPPMPPELAKLSYANSFTWKDSEGEDRYRRGMYTFFKRTIPHPTLMTFDCPDANGTAVSRTPSNTPLQALTLLNNDSFLEASQALSESTCSHAATDEARLNEMFLQCLMRSPSSMESSMLRQLLERARDFYQENESLAKELVGRRSSRATDTVELAAWTIVSRAIFNLDEFITRE